MVGTTAKMLPTMVAPVRPLIKIRIFVVGFMFSLFRYESSEEKISLPKMIRYGRTR
jgi:hypothetical protein